ncbi:MAG: hypothetical protein ACR5LF_14150 [Symbiopectobacterium sp.]
MRFRSASFPSIALYVLRPVQVGYQVLLLRRNGHTQPGQWYQIAVVLKPGKAPGKRRDVKRKKRRVCGG